MTETRKKNRQFFFLNDLNGKILTLRLIKQCEIKLFLLIIIKKIIKRDTRCGFSKEIIQDIKKLFPYHKNSKYFNFFFFIIFTFYFLLKLNTKNVLFIIVLIFNINRRLYTVFSVANIFTFSDLCKNVFAKKSKSLKSHRDALVL